MDSYDSDSYWSKSAPKLVKNATNWGDTALPAAKAAIACHFLLFYLSFFDLL